MLIDRTKMNVGDSKTATVTMKMFGESSFPFAQDWSKA